MILLDTNILLRFVDKSSSHYPIAYAAIQAIHAAGEMMVFVPQSVYEFWATATRPIASNGLSWTPTICQTQLLLLRGLFQLLPDHPTLFDEWLSLVTLFGCHGRVSFDAQNCDLRSCRIDAGTILAF